MWDVGNENDNTNKGTDRANDLVDFLFIHKIALDRTLRWVQRQVALTLKMLKKIDKGNGTDYMEMIEQQAKLTEKHEMIIRQQTTPAKDLVES